MRLQWLLILTVTCACLGCSSNAKDPSEEPNSIFGEWEAVSGEVFGKAIDGKGEWGMRITFGPDKATWHFNTPGGVQSFDGYCRIDAEKQPCEIDLRQPKSVDLNRTAYGIYRIEGDTLRISMGQTRPKNFDEPSLSKILFKRVVAQERPHE